MGNLISFDVEEFYFKFSYLYDDKLEGHENLSKYIQWTTFQAGTFSSFLGKILLTDISDHLLKSDSEIVGIKKFVEKEFIKGKSDAVFTINITGSGFDIYNAELNNFFGKFLNKYTFQKQKLMKCFATGLTFLREIPDKHFFYQITPFPIVKLNHIKSTDCTEDKKLYKDITEVKGDMMVINVRSGLSYFRVDHNGCFERLSGSIIGETTFASLIRLLAGYENCMEALDESFNGDFTAVDLTVGDIYGGGCEDLGLPDELLASSMGKVQYVKDKNSLKPRDLAKSITIMFAINIANMSNLVAESAGLKTLIFHGFPHLGFQTLISTIFGRYNNKSLQLFFIDNSEYVACMGMNLLSNEAKIVELNGS